MSFLPNGSLGTTEGHRCCHAFSLLPSLEVPLPSPSQLAVEDHMLVISHGAFVGLRGLRRERAGQSICFHPCLLAPTSGGGFPCSQSQPCPAYCSRACAPRPGTRAPARPKPGFALTCSQASFQSCALGHSKGWKRGCCFYPILPRYHLKHKKPPQGGRSPQRPFPHPWRQGVLGRLWDLRSKG